MVMSGNDVYSILERLISKANENQEIKQKISGWDKVFQFKPTDGEAFILQISNGVLSLSKGLHPSPNATIEASSQDLASILKGELDAVKAFFSGRLKIKGDVFATQELNNILTSVVKS